MMHSKIIMAIAATTLLLGQGAVYAAKSPEKSKAAPTAKARTAADTVVSVQPPSGQWEGKPPRAEGWVWSAGYYQWKDDRFQWKAGEWVQDKAGMDYRQHEWVPAGEGKWKLVGGDWIAEKQASSK